jgi:hypothetical protein
MLISKSTIAKGDIASFKLVNGDEIVSRVEEIEGDVYSLNRPCLVVPSQQGIGLIQCMFSADPDTTVRVNKQHIMMMAPTFDKLQSHYIQTTTGIQPVSKGSIIS